jgi:methionyl-tRNA formyltransferase
VRPLAWCSRPRSGAALPEGALGARIGGAATAEFGADVLERLAERHDVAFVLTRPDRPAGRGRKTTPPPAKVVAERLGIPVLQPERPAEAELDAETIVLVAYGALIPRELLERHEWLNVHPSLLPRWRGAAPVERAIMAGDGRTGVTVIRLVEELDAGPIGAQQAFRIGLDDDAGAVYRRAAELAPGLLERATSFAPQEGEATYADKIGPADREVDWSRPAAEIHNRIRALSPHIGARGELRGRRVLLWRSRLAGGDLEILEVQPEGGRRMTTEEFLRGLHGME